MPDTVEVPIWLLDDESISPEMLKVWIKIKAKKACTAREVEIIRQLAAKGLVRGRPDVKDDSVMLFKNDSVMLFKNIASEGADFSITEKSEKLVPRAGVRRESTESQKTGLSRYRYISQGSAQLTTNQKIFRKHAHEYAREEEQKQRDFNTMEGMKTKIRRFNATDKRPFEEKWRHFWRECHRVHYQGCVSCIRCHLQRRLSERAQATGIELVLDSQEWRTTQVGHAKGLVQQYPKWQTDDWREAIDWFLNDDFWQNVIIDVKTLRKHINRYVIWRQKKEPQKSKFNTVKIIGRER